MDKHRLIVDSVVVRFGEKTVLTGGYITAETGRVTGLLGRNGAGKSCMFRALMGGLRVENVVVGIDYMILMSEAPFYILDEPFTQVDPVNIDEVKSLIRERSKDHGIIITDHNYDAISTVTDNLFVISDGYTSPVQCREDLVRHGYLRA